METVRVNAEAGAGGGRRGNLAGGSTGPDKRLRLRDTGALWYNRARNESIGGAAGGLFVRDSDMAGDGDGGGGDAS